MAGFSDFESGWAALQQQYGSRLADRPGRIPTKTLFWLALYATDQQIADFEHIPTSQMHTTKDVRASARRQLARILRLRDIFQDPLIEETWVSPSATKKKNGAGR